MYDKEIFNKNEDLTLDNLNENEVQELRNELVQNVSSMDENSLNAIVELLNSQKEKNLATSNFLASIDSLLGSNNVGSLSSTEGSIFSAFGDKKEDKKASNPLGAIVGSVLGNFSSSKANSNPLLALIQSQLPNILKTIDVNSLLSIAKTLKQVDSSLITKILGNILK